MRSDYGSRIVQAAEAIQEVEYVLIGGGAGLSDAAGIKYSGIRFVSNFGDFIERYGLTDMYSATFYPFKTEEERWAYLAKHIRVNRYDPPAADLYRMLLRLVEGKKFFVVTTNVESQFYKAGFPAERVFAVQGDYGYFQCAKGCHDRLYDNDAPTREMVARTADCRIPSELVPFCPVCLGGMEINVRKDEHFVQDRSWYEAQARYEAFLEKSLNARTVYLELGVGFNTPGIIRIPFEKMTHANEKARLVRVNRDAPECAKENAHKSTLFDEDMARVIGDLIKKETLS